MGIKRIRRDNGFLEIREIPRTFIPDITIDRTIQTILPALESISP